MGDHRCCEGLPSNTQRSNAGKEGVLLGLTPTSPRGFGLFGLPPSPDVKMASGETQPHLRTPSCFHRHVSNSMSPTALHAAARVQGQQQTCIHRYLCILSRGSILHLQPFLCLSGMFGCSHDAGRGLHVSERQ